MKLKTHTENYMYVLNPLVQRNFIIFSMFAALVLLAFQAISLQGYIGSDFKIFYTAIMRFIENPLTLYQEGSKESLQGYLYPPPSIFLFLPFSFFNLEDAFFLFTSVILLSTCASIYIWLRLITKNSIVQSSNIQSISILLLLLATGCVFSARAGQIDPFVLLICMAAFALLTYKPFIAGILIGVGTWIKIYPILLLLILLKKKPFQSVLMGFLLSGTIAALLAFALMPTEIMLNYFSVILPEMSGRTIINIYNQSLVAIGLRITLPIQEAVTTFNSHAVPFLISSIVKIFFLLGLFTLIKISKNRCGGEIYSYSITLAFIPLIAPLGWGHTYVYVLPLLTLVYLRASTHSIKAILSVIVAYCLLLPSAHHKFSYLEGMPNIIFEVLFARYAISSLILIFLGLYFLTKQPLCEENF